MRDKPAHNATSRYAKGIYICSPCGVREAFEGNVWSPNLRMAQAVKYAQEPWVDCHV